MNKWWARVRLALVVLFRGKIPEMVAMQTEIEQLRREREELVAVATDAIAAAGEP